MKSGKPFQILHGNVKRFREVLRLGAKHIPPAFALIVAQTLRVFSSNGDNCSPNISGVTVQLSGNLGELHGNAIVCEQSVRAKALRSRTGSDIVCVGFDVHALIRMIFYRSGNEIRGEPNGFILQIVFVLKGLFAVREVLDQASNQIRLFLSYREQTLTFVDPFNTFPFGNVLRITARSHLSGWLDVLELGYQPRHNLSPLPFDGLLQ